MALSVITIPCLSDNYAFILRCTDTGITAVVDAPEATPILAELKTTVGFKFNFNHPPSL